jgi:phenylalanyl-tRNA synthetase beta chain
MKYHLNWIKQYISLKDNLENLVKNMTMKMFEVEDEIVNNILPDLLVIGYVTAVTQHPNADKLKVCQIDCGAHGNFQICTWGENVAEWLYVPVALPGCYLPAIDLKIEPRPMRGEESNGMICSKGELGINEDEDQHWIWLLDDDLHDLSADDKGKNMKDKYPWLENVQFEVKNIAITTRPDLTGYWGVACELNAVYADSGLIQFNQVPTVLNELQHLNISEALHTAPNARRWVQINTDLCACYSLVEFDGITVKPSDLYQRMMVYGTGAVPRSNWVDWSNNFMNLTGQPVHCFDSSKLVWDIIVRTANDGEQFTDLLWGEHILQTWDIVICDNEKIIALAGVIGGMNTAISDTTSKVSVEVAQFDPTQVRKTATRLWLRTDAAVRFEKYINPYWTQYCSMIVAEQIRKQVPSLGQANYIGITHKVNTMPARTPVTVSVAKAQQFIWGSGQAYSGEQMKKLLENLWFIVNLDADMMVCMPPIWRSPVDITHTQDIYEEIGRIVWYENLGTQTLKTSATPQLNIIPQMVRKIEDTMVMKYGYNQVETYLWTEQKYLELLGQYDSNSYTLLNPLSPEQTIIRPMLYPGLVQSVVKNHRMHDEVKVFETAHVVDSNGVETHHVCIVSYTPKNKNTLDDAIIQHKTILSDIVGQYDISATNKEYLHPTKQGEVTIGNEIVGLIWQIHPLVCDELGLNIDYQLVVTEVNLTALIAQGWTWVKSGKSYITNQHHIITRDVSFGLTGSATYEQILSIAQSAKGIDKVEVFDLYQPRTGDGAISNKAQDQSQQHNNSSGDWASNEWDIDSREPAPTGEKTSAPEGSLKTIWVRFTMVYDEAPSTESVTKKVEYIVGQIAKIEGVSVR